MKKLDQAQKSLNEKVEIACGHVRECCGYAYECEGTHHLLPTGKIILKHCGC
ncbi:hypothetical protein [Bacillus cereus group sp. N24]|uniref:hypothetical protein n=1 Tax=Bacillus cereus group sp. N24 TaxID=2794592 RepID=UPI0018F3C81B|nr:hypothetical protein [Bacillus cereus group sp. N24]MBJ7950104.1 hypothetical protein [Bacillus cereus group sp. N24]